MANESNGQNVSEFGEYQLYLDYKDAGPSFLLISTALVLNLISVPGIAMNLAIIFVTAKYRSLRNSSSSFLLALTALYEFVHALGHFPFLAVAISGLNFIPFSLSFKLLLVPFTCNMASLCAIAMTGLDRFVQLAFPNLNLAHPICLFAYFAVSFGAGIFCACEYWVLSQGVPPSWPQTGFIGDLLPDGLGQVHLTYMFAMNVLAVALYLAIWLLLRFKTSSASIHSHILKSMVVIISINIGGYLLNAGVRLFLIPQLGLDQIRIWLIQTYFGIFLNICVALNAVVLYICSSEYRQCFSTELRLLFCRNRVQTLSANIPTNISTKSAAK